MQKSESIAKLVSALAKAQSSFKRIEKKTLNTYFQKKYADLAEVIDCTQPALIANGLVLIQLPFCENNQAGIETVLAHESGEYISERSTIPAEQKNPQTFGVALSYLRRYAENAILNVAADDASDDDGTSISQPSPPKTPKVNQTPAKAGNQPRPSEKKEQKEQPIQKTDENVAGTVSAENEKEPAAEYPSKEELKSIQGDIRNYAEKVDKEDLIAFIRKTANQEDSKHITKAQWNTIFSLLKNAEKNNTLEQLVRKDKKDDSQAEEGS